MTIAELFRSLRPSLRAKVLVDLVNATNNSVEKEADLLTTVKDLPLGYGALRKAVFAASCRQNNALKMGLLRLPDAQVLLFEDALQQMEKSPTNHEQIQALQDAEAAGMDGTEFFRFLLKRRSLRDTEAVKLISVALVLGPDPKKLGKTLLARRSQETAELKEMFDELGWLDKTSARTAQIYTVATSRKPELVASLDALKLKQPELRRMFRMASRVRNEAVLCYATEKITWTKPDPEIQLYADYFYGWGSTMEPEQVRTLTCLIPYFSDENWASLQKRWVSKEFLK